MLPPKHRLHNGYTLYEGPSLLTGDKIAIVITCIKADSTNPKTGPVIQTYCFSADHHPTQILHDLPHDQPHPTCGLCPLRDQVCYVNRANVNQVWNAYKAGKYPLITDEAYPLIKAMSRNLRLTTYGEAPSVPPQVFDGLIKVTDGVLGYTHQWRTCDPYWRNYLMASVESKDLALEAQSLGWRTYRVVGSPEEELLPNEILCPHYTNKHIKCDWCKKCSGLSSPTSKNIVIPVHGQPHKTKAFHEMIMTTSY